MKNKTLRAALLTALAAAIIFAIMLPLLSWAAQAPYIGPNAVVGTLPTQQQSYSTIGQGSITFSGSTTSVLNLSGSLSASVPCNSLILSVSGASVLVGSTSSSQPLVATAGNLVLPGPNVNSFWVSGGTASTVGYLYWKN